MTVTVKFFAFLEEKLGFDSDTLDISHVKTVKQLKEEIQQRYPAVSNDIPYCMIAVDMEFKSDEEQLAAEKEIAVIPPVSGG
ncbi:molybdopterin converting factor subunit 1 [Bacillus aerolatus]|uniref:Molybdopterin synthase sulfur carrier subunit n=1 Tax=Bacillus aerolatus TaxID=2653354 RepID=A0A6I1FH28_9BACI|nr:molybdopterin converting factor subunit 1 [Bacillus aerolatus]KAB7707566.1 molybdopterin converting factor subunit 1 [Bacillus aerolatus]